MASANFSSHPESSVFDEEDFLNIHTTLQNKLIDASIGLRLGKEVLNEIIAHINEIKVTDTIPDNYYLDYIWKYYDFPVED